MLAYEAKSGMPASRAAFRSAMKRLPIALAVTAATAAAGMAVASPSSAPSKGAADAGAVARDAAAPVDPCAGPADLTKRDELTCADRKAWYGVVGWSEECEVSHDHSAIEGTGSLTFTKLGPGRWLGTVLCTLGAYQGEAELFVLEDGVDGGSPKATRLRFKVPGERRGTLTTTFTVSNFADYDAKKRELRTWTRYRGPGDCGSMARYAIVGTRAVLRELREQRECNGKETNENKWPRIYP